MDNAENGHQCSKMLTNIVKIAQNCSKILKIAQQQLKKYRKKSEIEILRFCIRNNGQGSCSAVRARRRDSTAGQLDEIRREWD